MVVRTGHTWTWIYFVKFWRNMTVWVSDVTDRHRFGPLLLHRLYCKQSRKEKRNVVWMDRISIRIPDVYPDLGNGYQGLDIRLSDTVLSAPQRAIFKTEGWTKAKKTLLIMDRLDIKSTGYPTIGSRNLKIYIFSYF